MTMFPPDMELKLLDTIRRIQPTVRQRDLAKVVGRSLGMTNAVLKRLVRKGWLTIRKVNNRNIQYAVSAEGLAELARGSYRYLRRTIGNIVRYRDAIENVVDAAAKRGCREVVLVGDSDLDFIVEHASTKSKMRYRRGARVPRQLDSRAFVIFGEIESGATIGAMPDGAVFLRAVLADGLQGTARDIW